jgi:hypothetical protein
MHSIPPPHGCQSKNSGIENILNKLAANREAECAITANTENRSVSTGSQVRLTITCHHYSKMYHHRAERSCAGKRQNNGHYKNGT